MDDEKERLREHLISRGRHAVDVLNNPAFASAIEEVQADLFVRFQGASAEQVVEREKIWAIGRAVDQVHERLKAFVDVGRIEQENKAEDAKR